MLMRFAYDGVNILAEFDGSNGLLRRYVFGNGTDDPIVQYEGTGTTDRRFMSSDERGSITALTDSAGALVGINTYVSALGIRYPTNRHSHGRAGD